MENNTRYWENEKPLIMTSGNIRVIYYERSGVLQLGFLVENEEGQRVLGRKISLRRDKLAETPRILFLISDVLKKWRKEIDGD